MTPAANPLLLCYDGSDNASHAIGVIARLMPSSPCVVLSVSPSPGLLFAGAGLGGAGYVSADTVALVEGAAADSSRQHANEGTRLAIEAGLQAQARPREAATTVPQAILDTADELQTPLIVIGSRGLGPVRSALLGSVSHAVLHRARTPVLVVPPAE